MLKSLSEYKFFQAFRVPVESTDQIRFLVEQDLSEPGQKSQMVYIEDALLLDMSLSGLGFSSQKPLSEGTYLRISLQFKKIVLDLDATIVRSFNDGLHNESICYGVEFDEGQPKIKRFLETYVQSLPPERLRESLLKLSLSPHYSNYGEGFEMFSLLLSLFNDMTQFGQKEKFSENMLEEVVRLLDASRAVFYLINPQTDHLEAKAATGIDKEKLKFDYRRGIPGSVFTTGLSLNMQMTPESTRLAQDIEHLKSEHTQSVICVPLLNREDKTVGVLEVTNKRGKSRFSLDDERVMKLLGMVFSSVLHDYNPVSEKTRIRRFSAPFNRKFAIIGKSSLVSDMRQSIVKMKDLDTPLLIEGEVGVGKTLLAQVMHHEGKRGLKPFISINCSGRDEVELEREVFGEQGALVQAVGGVVLFHEIGHLSLRLQEKLTQFLGPSLVNSEELPPRLMATTTKDLQSLVEEDGLFNRELFQHFSMATVTVGALRKRGVEDIQDLTRYFLRKECEKQGFLPKELSEAIMTEFMKYDWPGNIKELKESVQKIVLYNPKRHIITRIDDKALPIINKKRSALQILADIPFAANSELPLKERVTLIEQKIILAEIKKNNGNKSKTAKLMGISREALRKKLLQSNQVLKRLKAQQTEEQEQKAA